MGNRVSSRLSKVSQQQPLLVHDFKILEFFFCTGLSGKVKRLSGNAYAFMCCNLAKRPQAPGNHHKFLHPIGDVEILISYLYEYFYFFQLIRA